MKKLLKQIDDLEQSLRNHMETETQKAERYNEENSIPFDDFTEDENGKKTIGILYPENVAPELDMAIHHLHEAWHNLTNHVKDKTTWKNTASK